LKTVLILIAVAVCCFLLFGCAAGANQLASTASHQGRVAGFWLGLWHGVIAPVTLVISLFSRTVQMYEVHNNGGWYNFGFLLGMMIILGGGGRGTASGRRRD
jgi:hypothetical protein